MEDELRRNLLLEFDNKYKIEEIDIFIKKCSYKIIFKIDKCNIFLLDHHINDVYINRIKKLCKRIKFLLDYFKIDKIINIWLLPVEINREFPEDSIEISEKNINGGYTYTVGNNIFIYRLEEFPKVILHEIIHHTIIDTDKKWSKNNIEYLIKLFKIDDRSNFIPNEAIVETWATLFQLLFISEELNISFNELYKNELKWSMRQSKRILEHQSTLCNMNECKWNEITNSYSYIVIKTILLYNIKKFVATNLPYNINEIIKIIENNNFIKKIKGIKNHNNSLRMTLYGDL
jgi:hypothetical protein